MSDQTQGMEQPQTGAQPEPQQTEPPMEPQTDLPQIEPYAEPQTEKNAKQADAAIYNAPDVYEAQSSQDIYQTPATELDCYSTRGRFSGTQPEYNGFDGAQHQQNAYGGSPYENIPSAYGNGNYGGTYGGKDVYPYVNGAANMQGQFGNERNGGWNAANPQGQYGNAGNWNANAQSQYGNLGNGAAGTQSQYGNPGIGNGAANTQNQYGNAGNWNANTQSQYGNSGNGSFSNQYQYGNPYGTDPNGYNYLYSPYAAPQKRKHTGLIIGAVITVVILFLTALFMLIYRTFEVISEKGKAAEQKQYNNQGGTGNDPYYYDYGDDYFYDYDDDYFYDYDDDYFYDYDDDYFYDYDHNHGYGDHDYNHHGYYNYGDGYDYNDNQYDYDSDEYYTLHDDIKNNLSYSIDWEEYVYDTDNENVSIMVDYPVIVGKDVPNLGKINEKIAEEVSTLTNYYEDGYADYMYDNGSYFNAYSSGYVTYMDEDVLSVVFSEHIYADYYQHAFLYCINIDMKDGVIMDNTDIIKVDDAFSVEFRLGSDKQNGSISGLSQMTDQEITEYLTSADNLIIFYTPQGMEIGFNYSDGWVTVTYKDYLKIF